MLELGLNFAPTLKNDPVSRDRSRKAKLSEEVSEELRARVCCAMNVLEAER